MGTELPHHRHADTAGGEREGKLVHGNPPHQELMSGAKERPTAHHSVQRHSQKYLDHHYLIRKMVVYAISDLPSSMYMATQQDQRGYSPAS